MVLRLSTFAADVRAIVLTGLSTATSTAAAATDTVLAGIGKLQAQVTLAFPTFVSTFPGSPKTGQAVFNTTDGKLYLYNGSAWVESTNVTVNVATSLVAGLVKVSTGLAVDSAGALSVAGDFMLFNNRIINGEFRVNQRAAGTLTTASATAYVVDRWKMQYSVSTYSSAAFALTDTDRTAVGDEEARTGISVTTTGTAGGSDFCILAHAIEYARTLAGKTVTLSVWAQASTTGKSFAIEVAQNFGTGGSPSTFVTAVAALTALTTSWVRYSVTFTLPSVAGKTFGTNSDDALTINFWTSAGSTFNSRTGSLGQQSSTIKFYGPQLEAGTVATPIEKVPYGISLAMCQRYYQRAYFLGGAYQSAGAQIYATGAVTVTMRAEPTLSVVADNNSSGLGSISLGSNVLGFNLVYFAAVPSASGAYVINYSIQMSADL